MNENLYLHYSPPKFVIIHITNNFNLKPAGDMPSKVFSTQPTFAAETKLFTLLRKSGNIIAENQQSIHLTDKLGNTFEIKVLHEIVD